MSLLNLSNYDNGNEQLGAELVDFPRQKDDMPNIFEEIEQLLRHNECLEHDAKSTPTAAEAVAGTIPVPVSKECSLPRKSYTRPPAFDINSNSSDVPLDYLPSYSAHDFLIPEDAHNFQEDPLLYSVNQNELHPITSPFMVPGIYKKIATAPIITAKTTDAETAESDNVYISEKGPSGRIVSRNNFQKLYEEGNEVGKSTVETTVPYKSEVVPQVKQTDDGKSKHWEALSKLAYSIFKYSNADHIVIDGARNQVVRTRDGTNQKTIYRFLEPEALGLSAPNMTAHNRLVNQPARQKLGRPKKRSLDELNHFEPQAAPQAVTPKQKCTEKEQPATNKQQFRTRSGRLVKLVRPLATAKNFTNDLAVPAEWTTDVPNLLNELKDTDYKCNKPIEHTTKPTPPVSEMEAPLASSSPIKRHVPPESICPTCKKIFLGKRLQRHFVQNPDHMRPLQAAQESPPPPAYSYGNQLCNADDMTLFRFLIAKLQKSHLNEDQRADLFLNELNDLIEQLQLRSSRLIRNTSGLHFVTARTARVLGIPEGQYALDMSALEAPPEPESNYEQKHISMPPISTVNARSLDYTTISLDDTLTDEAAQKLNLSAGGKLLPPSEESLLRAVGDLVHEDMTKLVGTTLLHPPVNAVGAAGVNTLMPHYDNASDNAVEAMNMKETNITQQTAPLLDLSVDFFQFKNN